MTDNYLEVLQSILTDTGSGLDLRAIADALTQSFEGVYCWYVNPETYKVERVQIDILSTLQNNGFYKRRIDAEKKSKDLLITEMIKHGRWDLAENLRKELETLEEDHPEWLI